MTVQEPSGSHLAGRVIVVTGAAGGFGRLVCTGAAARGANVVATDIDQGGLDTLVAELVASGAGAIGVAADVTDLASLARVVDAAVAEWNAVDVMINNAGVMPLAFFADHQRAAEAWSRCIDINIKGVMNGMIAVHDQMSAQGRGHVVNLSSIYGNAPVVGAAVYGATKAAVNVMSESFRVETQGRIKVTIVKPTGVPATGLSSGVINPAAVVGILGQNTVEYGAVFDALGTGRFDAVDLDPDSIGYAVLDPQHVADQILYAIDQPWGVSIGDITIRAAGDRYIL
jgi:NADP-dependent 3-hydroxy acid dehydrogenase YdfG